MIKLIKTDFDITKVISQIITPKTGCIILFVGVVRGETHSKLLEFMEIEVYQEMALYQLKSIRKETISKFGVNEVAIIHRYGKIPVGENILLIAISASHREEAYTANRYVIDEIKKRVPIWKKEYTSGGSWWVEGYKPE
jgi:molybdopterin synthase catalytic subunit